MASNNSSFTSGQSDSLNNSGASESPNNTILKAPSSYKVNSTENISKEALDALKASLRKQLEEAKQEHAVMIARFEKTENILDENIQAIMDKRDDLKKNVARAQETYDSAIEERDQAVQDLRNVERAFSDVHRKYERSKTVLENLKKNEDELKLREITIQEKLHSRNRQYEAFKQESEGVLSRMHSDFTERVSSIEGSNARLAAQLRRSEMRMENMKAELAQKRKENEELNNLMDDLIQKPN